MTVFGCARPRGVRAETREPEFPPSQKLDRMKNVFRATLKTLLAIVTVIVVALGVSAAVNLFAGKSEAAHLPEYGQFVAVDGKRMNAVITGDGEQTIVLIPGFGTAAPALDFAPLAETLSAEYRVIALEPFGYGLSDPTDSPRTAQNIVRELHTAVQELGVTEYTLMGHSIAGIYGLEWAAEYGDELTAFVGVDTSVPGQAGMDTEFPIGAMLTARALGIPRIMSALGDGLDGAGYSDEQREQMRVLSLKNSLAPTYVDEMERIAENFGQAQAEARTFPADLPLLLFAQAENPGQPDWVALHEEQAASVDRGELVLLDADHYLHHTKSAEIAADTAAFLGSLTGR